ncbi:MAG: hypothetical protein B6I24_04660 [Bacteroidetes bacterium 4572_128]|nr:MAG: hypothetical protein B6I24_04660 [Bacteroidetes bacterium 4572_128]
MKNYIIIQILFLSVLFSGKVFAQETNLGNSSLYGINRILINPANTGEIEKNRFFVNLRNQWRKIDGSPRNAIIGLAGHVSENVSLGGMLLQNQKGVLQRNAGIINYSYDLKMGDEHHVHFGLSGIFQDNSVSNSDIMSSNQDDIIKKAGEYYTGTVFGFGFGLRYTWNNLEIGASLPEMFSETYENKDSYFVFASYKIDVGENLMIEPSFLYKNIYISPSNFDFNIAVNWKKVIWLQFTYRDKASMIFALGADLGKFKVGYAYEMNSGDLSHYENNSLEAFIAYDFSWYKD